MSEVEHLRGTGFVPFPTLSDALHSIGRERKTRYAIKITLHYLLLSYEMGRLVLWLTFTVTSPDWIKTHFQSLLALIAPSLTVLRLTSTFRPHI